MNNENKGTEMPNLNEIPKQNNPEGVPSQTATQVLETISDVEALEPTVTTPDNSVTEEIPVVTASETPVVPAGELVTPEPAPEETINQTETPTVTIEPVELEKKLVVEEAAATPTEEKKSLNGGVIVLIVLLLILAGSIYYFATKGVLDIPFITSTTTTTTKSVTTTTTTTMSTTLTAGAYSAVNQNCPGKSMVLSILDTTNFTLDALDETCNIVNYTGTYTLDSSNVVTLTAADGTTFTGLRSGNTININHETGNFSFSL